jgi:hypothetical protein
MRPCGLNVINWMLLIACCSHLVFAPRQYGLLLTAGSQDGHVYIWEADRPLAPNSWTLQAQLQVGKAAGLLMYSLTQHQLLSTIPSICLLTNLADSWPPSCSFLDLGTQLC